MKIIAKHRQLEIYEKRLTELRDQQGMRNESNLRAAFQELLTALGHEAGWTFIPEYQRSGRAMDGALRDGDKLVRGYWEAKDTKDDLETEIQKKIKDGYPLTNMIFEDTRRAVLYQNDERVLEINNLHQADQLAALLTEFFSYARPEVLRFAQAVAEFKEDIPALAGALLHHPDYRARYAENLKRELPRIPLVPDAQDFAAFVQAGEQLKTLHLGYEQAEEYTLRHEETPGERFTWVVKKMRLAPDRQSIQVNEALRLVGIPPECFAYRLGNRSALEWVIDQYQVSTDARSGITSDPNREEEPDYIVRLLKRVVTVSLKTGALVAALPALPKVGG